MYTQIMIGPEVCDSFRIPTNVSDVLNTARSPTSLSAEPSPAVPPQPLKCLVTMPSMKTHQH